MSEKITSSFSKLSLVKTNRRYIVKKTEFTCKAKPQCLLVLQSLGFATDQTYNRNYGSSRKGVLYARDDGLHLSCFPFPDGMGKSIRFPMGCGRLVDAVGQDSPLLPLTVVAAADRGPTQSPFQTAAATPSQTVQALIEKFCATIDGVRTKRKNGDKLARYPYRLRRYFNPILRVRL